MVILNFLSSSALLRLFILPSTTNHQTPKDHNCHHQHIQGGNCGIRGWERTRDADRLESLNMFFFFFFFYSFTNFNYKYTTFTRTITTISNHSNRDSNSNSTSSTSNGGGSTRVEDSRCRCVLSPQCVSYFLFVYSFY